MNLTNLTVAALITLAIGACGSSSAASTPASTPGAASASSAPAASATAGESTTTNATSITERDFKFDTPDVTVAGSAVSLAVTNAGPTIHDLSIRDASGKVLGETEDLKAGASEALTLSLPAGTYVMFCSLPGHESLGLKGTLTVTP
jgi:uncharacterized cupredoxin-like copper-binding protein